mgnify:CR=1 FL=1
MALSANALVSLADAKDHLGIPSLEVGQDEIGRASCRERV